MPNSAIPSQVLEHILSRYFGKYRGLVSEVDEATMRIKASVPSVLGSQSTGWCTPCVPYAGPQVGFAFLPEVGAGVWVEFEAGDVSFPIWSGCYWHEGEVPPEAKANVKAIITAGGHKVSFDGDTPNLVMTDSSGNKITLDSDGILLERGSMKVMVSESKVDINSGALEVA